VVVQRWNLLQILTPGGTRSPVVLHSDDEARAVLIEIQPGQELGEHQVKEDAWVAVLSGSVAIENQGETVEVGAGELLRFDPNERRAISSPGGARVLLLLAPWPGEGHYRGGDHARVAID
jgi:quercetin dioxygenase-like cupin family protein